MVFQAGCSTIYRRHQARLFKNMEKPEDPRPKAVRVVAGLPGFRNFIGAYQAPGLSTPESLCWQQQPSVLPVASHQFAADTTIVQFG